LGAVGFASTGTLFSAVASNTRMRDVLLPVLFLPLSVPALIAAVETTSFALGNADDASFWWTLLVVYDVVFMTASLLVFEFVLEE
jgi:heme exporter protein B